MHEDQFTAIGPSFPESGKPGSAFSTDRKPFEYGVNVKGDRCGVYGESVRVDSNRDSTVEGVGVHGSGENFGVFGNGGRGIAGVMGQHNRGGSGVIGAVMRGGAGVVGASVQSLGNPLESFRSIPDAADGEGVGVIGMSGSGTGVQGNSLEGSGGDFSSTSGAGVNGRSEKGAGVLGQSESGPGVRAISTSDRGGIFESQSNVAQIQLIPLEQRTRGRKPKLPRDGNVGDLLLIRNTLRSGGEIISDKCSLWLCIPNIGSVGGARWQEVVLGEVVTGTA